MKKIVNINLGGSPFVIDEDAFSALNRYLDEIEIRLEGSEQTEVLEDVEIRIADLFNESLNSRVQVVNLAMVMRAIAVIGNANEFGEPRKSYQAKNYNNGTPARQHLYRSRTEQVIGGVCGGVADYFNIDVTLVRIITFIMIFLGGLSLWIYLILWMVIPKEPISINYNDSQNRRE